MGILCTCVNDPVYLRNPHQDDPGQLQHSAVRRTDPPAGDEGQEHRTRHRPPERPHLPPCPLQEERDHDRSRWDGNKSGQIRLQMAARRCNMETMKSRLLMYILQLWNKLHSLPLHAHWGSATCLGTWATAAPKLEIKCSRDTGYRAQVFKNQTKYMWNLSLSYVILMKWSPLMGTRLFSMMNFWLNKLVKG